MTKAEFIDLVADKAELSKKEAGAAVDAFTNAITEVLKNGGKITFPGFGTFDVKERAARTGRNPQTGKTLKIPASRVAHFKMGSKLKETL